MISKDLNDLDQLAMVGSYSDQGRKVVLTVDGARQVPQAIRSGQVINTSDVRSVSAHVPGWELAQSELTVPLKIGNQVIGAIDVQSTEPGAFKPEDERLITFFAERAAMALERGRLNEELERRILQLNSLRAVDLAISGSMDIKLTLGILLDQLTKHLGIDAADVLLFNPALQNFTYNTGQGFHTHALQYTNLNMDSGYAGRAARERQIITIQNLPENSGELQRSAEFSLEGFMTYLGVPLIAKGQIKGVLEIFQRQELKLDKEQHTFLDMLAGQAAIAIDNAQLFENLQGSNFELMMAYDETIEGWSRAMDLRDKETEGHTQRVTELTLRLAASLGLGAKEMPHIRRGALLHDIGKIGVPDDILHKPGPLTDEEWLIMRKHPKVAHDMLISINYLQPALDIPYCHHEKWDGTGYPLGLKGEQIPIAARIFSVVDVWDALLSDRPYRKAWPEDKVRQYIQEQASIYFDPHIVDVFLKMVPNGK
jgi:putative nucleotidyltransferase with HDIG domain